ncbi:hypothetical protein [Proteiniclasticum ruminis]|uniref:DUF4129 domain-containing protein n=1 Tax=Proteiniclasticum ruminis TaxID=398199 RepID=A0A1I5CID3_9CLOT|nr:hypothetical protein [Proteiniclasticum ruminis]SFN86647.1 hypothetical protein SAMN04488695_106135 [Proteiniclasticum ruminis]
MALLLLELLRVFSLTISILMIPFEVDPWEGFFILFYAVGISSLFLWRKWRKRPWNLLLIPLLFVFPLLLAFTTERAYFSIAYTGVLYVYYDVRLGILDPKDLSQRFKISYGLLLFLGVTASMAEEVRWILLKNLPFLLLYFFSTILLSVALRHQEAGIDPKKSRNRILLYLLVSILLSAVLGTEEARNLFYTFLQQVGFVLVSLLSYIVYPFAFAFYALFSRLKGFFRPPQFDDSQGAELGEDFQEEFSSFVENAREYPVLRTLLSLLLILAFLYLLYRFLRKKGEKPVEGLEYIEQRESLKEHKVQRRKTVREKEPDGLYEKLRYRYRTYLLKLRKEMEIHLYDTAEDVAVRAEEVSSKEHVKIRKIYQEVRYGERIVTRDLLDDFSSYLEDNHNEK